MPLLARSRTAVFITDTPFPVELVVCWTGSTCGIIMLECRWGLFTHRASECNFLLVQHETLASICDDGVQFLECKWQDLVFATRGGYVTAECGSASERCTGRWWNIYFFVYHVSFIYFIFCIWALKLYTGCELVIVGPSCISASSQIGRVNDYKQCLYEQVASYFVGRNRM